ncbi:MAG: phosphoribosylformylglycinamidine synthase [Firmicutes bacterium]|nr:phosphoribosylformylglycinamidine synthase [Bacillota bacterium]
MVRRVYVEKKPGFRVEAAGLLKDLRSNLGLKDLQDVRILHRYDVENLPEDLYEKAIGRILSEAPVDNVSREDLPADVEGKILFAVEYLPGQYDQRSDSAEQCIRLLSAEAEPTVACANVYVLTGDLTQEEVDKVKNYCINSVDSREASMTKPETLAVDYGVPDHVDVIDGFISMNEDQLKAMLKDLGLAMSLADLQHTQKYFAGEEHRDPTITEIRVLDTYWSDHCRHTTFASVIEDVEIEKSELTAPIEAAWQEYLEGKKALGREDKPVCLMDIALAAMREIKAQGGLADQEKSDEINACSIVIPVDVNGVTEDWLLMFKNETHNHPTEIEPFGGAATCLGGAIRDPLSGRSYVYQAMRITGGADPTAHIKDTIPGKLPQRKIAREAAHGYSSYGNQIGLTTGYVREIYHPGYVAKHMELGAVMAAAPVKNVKREKAEPGDVIILLGGRTGRDGIGGATGSSKAHTEESITTCGAEVQKGNAPTERKLQRLFRRPEAAHLIKICNDFGAGGVCVAIGELAAGLKVDLDLVPKKYAGLDGTELAISESQERMAVVVEEKDADEFMRLASEENLETTKVAVVTEEPRLKLYWRGQSIVDMARSFIDTNGAKSYTKVKVTAPENTLPLSVPEKAAKAGSFAEGVRRIVSDLSVCSQRGLVEMFDSTIGASTVLMPFGGKYQKTPIQTMAAKIPVLYGETKTASTMAYGYDPYVSSWSPFHGASYAVMESVAKTVAAGADYKKIRFTFQEFFERMTEDPTRWGKPFAALLGGYVAQQAFGLPSIGGKDSMSGSFNEIDVPPTLVSLAVDTVKTDDVITPELKAAGNVLVYLTPGLKEDLSPDYGKAKAIYDLLLPKMKEGRVKSAYAVTAGGIIEAVFKMAIGNGLGVAFTDAVKDLLFTAPVYGSLVVETDDISWLDPLESGISVPAVILGRVTEEPALRLGEEEILLSDAEEGYNHTLERVYKTQTEEPQETGGVPLFTPEKKHVYTGVRTAKPRVFIPVFPGTNCEYDTGRAFYLAGAEPDVFVLRNLTSSDIQESVEEIVKRLSQAQILMLSGGFSAGDEPEGSGKFIATVFSNDRIREATMKLLEERDGLALGICNGFQALIKLGLVPYGRILPLREDQPTLTYNSVGRHISCMVNTRVTSTLSPWLYGSKAGDIHTIAVSHGEGRFVAPTEVLEQLKKNGQIATQYVDLEGKPSMNIPYNPNGSMWAIEGITSPDGRVLGKMGHSERIGDNVAKNIYGNKDQKIIENGVAYFR